MPFELKKKNFKTSNFFYPRTQFLRKKIDLNKHTPFFLIYRTLSEPFGIKKTRNFQPFFIAHHRSISKKKNILETSSFFIAHHRSRFKLKKQIYQPFLLHIISAFWTLTFKETSYKHHSTQFLRKKFYSISILP